MKNKLLFKAVSVLCAAVVLLSGCSLSGNTSTKASSSSSSQKATSSENKAPRSTKGDGIYAIANVIKMTYRSQYTDKIMPYCLILPDDYDPNEDWPVLLYLHGAGELGTDNETPIHVMLEYMYRYCKSFMQKMIVVCPQTDEFWTTHDEKMQGNNEANLKTVKHLMDDLMEKYAFDPKRIYVMGISMGGIATWEMLATYPKYFAAGVPICGSGDISQARRLVNMPIWAYHSTDDPTVDFRGTDDMYKEIKRLGGEKIKFTVLEDAGHAAWDYAMGDTEMLEWLLEQHK